MTDKPTTDDNERTMIEVSLGMERQAGCLRITEIGRFELKAGDVLWIKTDTILSDESVRRNQELLAGFLPDGVKIIFAHGMRPIAVHREDENWEIGGAP